MIQFPIEQAIPEYIQLITMAIHTLENEALCILVTLKLYSIKYNHRFQLQFPDLPYSCHRSNNRQTLMHISRKMCMHK